jgi:hypothetical protein
MSKTFPNLPIYRREVPCLLAADLLSRKEDLRIYRTSTTVSHIENGTRALSVEEFVLLPAVLKVKLAKLFEPDQPVALGPEGSLPWSVVAKVLAGRALPGDPAKIMLPADDALPVVLPRLLERVGEIRQLWPDATLAQVKDAETAAERVAERKAAAKFGVPARDLSIAASRLWEGGLTAERDRRLRDRVDADTLARSRQAIRGRITRELLDELRPHIEKEKRK